MAFCIHCGTENLEIAKFCKKCGKEIDPVQVRPEVQSMTDPNVVGKTCPYCQAPIKQGADIVECPACGMPHHRECWTENGNKCTTFGCSGTIAGFSDFMHQSDNANNHQTYSEETHSASSQNQIEGNRSIPSLEKTILYGMVAGVVSLLLDLMLGIDSSTRQQVMKGVGGINFFLMLRGIILAVPISIAIHILYFPSTKWRYQAVRALVYGALGGLLLESTRKLLIGVFLSLEVDYIFFWYVIFTCLTYFPIGMALGLSTSGGKPYLFKTKITMLFATIGAGVIIVLSMAIMLVALYLMTGATLKTLNELMPWALWRSLYILMSIVVVTYYFRKLIDKESTTS